jgi:hypothetical protein
MAARSDTYDSHLSDYLLMKIKTTDIGRKSTIYTFDLQVQEAYMKPI